MDEKLKLLTQLGEFIRRSRVAQKTLDVFRSERGIRHTISYDNNTLAYTNNDDDDIILHKLIMSTRTFVGCNSKFNMKKVFQEIEKYFSNRILSEKLDSILRAFSEIERPTGITVSDRSFSHLELYHLMADEFYFRSEPGERNKIVSTIFSNPFSVGIAKVCFERVLLLLCELSSMVSEVAQEIRREEYANSGIDDRCIFCKDKSSSYRSEEHILPFDINNDLILPRGYVCDQCNNGQLSILDQKFLDFPPVKGVVALFSAFTRNGDFREARFQNAFMKHTGPGMLEVHYHSGRVSSRPEPTHENGPVKFQTEFVGSTMTEKRIREFKNSLLKIALEMVAYDRGHEEALSSKYDLVRETVMSQREFNMNVVISTEAVPEPYLRVVWDEREDLHAYAIGLYGVGISFAFKPSNEVLERFEIPKEMNAVWL